QVQKDVEGRRPRAGAHRRPGLRQRLGDREAIPPIISDARDQGSLASKIDAQHQMKNLAATGINCGCFTSACAKIRPSVRCAWGIAFTVRASPLKNASSSTSSACL